MLKFLRKYQKWMLAVFCVALMVAFLIPQAASQFAPQPAKRTMATTGDGEKITREMLQRTAGELQMMRRLRLDPIVWPGLALLPNSGDELDDAMQWTLIQRAAARNNLGASQQEAFSLIASLFNVQDKEALETEAAKLKANADYLMSLGRQYLIAEQYRQLVGGIEYTTPSTSTTQTGSPGLKRHFAAVDASQIVQQQLQNPQLREYAMMQGMSEQQLLMTVLEDLRRSRAGIEITGYERVSSDQVRYLLQRELTQLDLTVVVLDAEDRLATVGVTEDDIKSLFERYADDAAGTGSPYGLGYRVPDRFKFEALRIPIDAVREKIAREITAEDVRTFFDANQYQYEDTSEVGEDGVPKPVKLTADLRDEIRETLTQVRAEQRVIEIAQQARLRLNEDARGLKEDGPFKKLPDGFEPTPMVVLADEIEQEHGITPEIIQVDEWMTAKQINEQARFTQTWLREMPTTSVRLPNPQYGFLMDRPVPTTVLGGRAGLFASFVPDVTSPMTGQPVSLAEYATYAKDFVDPESEQAEQGLQVGLPGRFLSDLTSSTYVFRLTETDPAHPASDLSAIKDQVREDAKKVNAYLSLVEDRESLLQRAAEQSVERLMADADSKKSLTGVTRRMASPQQQRQGMASLDDISSTAPIIEQAFGLADKLGGPEGLESAAAKDRLVAVELAPDYKLAIVRIDEIRPIPRSVFKRQARDPGILAAAARANASPDTPAPLSMEALMQATGFKWAEGYGPENLEDEDEEQEEADSE